MGFRQNKKYVNILQNTLGLKQKKGRIDLTKYGRKFNVLKTY